jgi:hypothetical protein
MAKIEFSRLVWKRSSTAGVEPTIPSDETISEDWLPTDLLIGEGFINTIDERIWYRAANRIVEITSQSYGFTTQTTDATPASITSIPIPTSVCMTIQAVTNAMQTDDSNGFGSKIIGTFRNDAGTVTQVGTETTNWKHTDFTSLSFAFSIVGTDVHIGVVGEVATTVDWTCRYVISFVETGLI